MIWQVCWKWLKPAVCWYDPISNFGSDWTLSSLFVCHKASKSKNKKLNKSTSNEIRNYMTVSNSSMFVVYTKIQTGNIEKLKMGNLKQLNYYLCNTLCSDFG